MVHALPVEVVLEPGPPRQPPRGQVTPLRPIARFSCRWDSLSGNRLVRAEVSPQGVQRTMLTDLLLGEDWAYELVEVDGGGFALIGTGLLLADVAGRDASSAIRAAVELIKQDAAGRMLRRLRAATQREQPS